MNKNRKISIVLLASVLLLTLLLGISATPVTTKMFLARGNVAGINVSVYQDSACTQPLTLLDWGIMAQGSNNTHTIYIRNEGNVPETLSLSASDWQPAGIGSLSWNREGAVLNANTTASATLSLAVSDVAPPLSEFSFNVTITGTA